jgi:hypothetical protein
MDAGFLAFVGILGANIAGVLILNAVTSSDTSAMSTGLSTRPLEYRS